MVEIQKLKLVERSLTAAAFGGPTAIRKRPLEERLMIGEHIASELKRDRALVAIDKLLSGLVKGEMAHDRAVEIQFERLVRMGKPENALMLGIRERGRAETFSAGGILLGKLILEGKHGEARRLKDALDDQLDRLR